MFKKLILACLLSCFVFVPLQLTLPCSHVQALELSPQDAIARLFTSPQVQQDWFVSSFIRQIPLPRIENILNNIQQTLGTYQSIEKDGEDYRVIFEKGVVPTKIRLNSEGKIVTLLFQSPIANQISLEEAVEKYQELPGKVSFLVLEGDSILAALNPDQPLGVGSAFKLAVLATLQQQIDAGDHTWEDVVQLQPNWKSLPSGVLQTWPDFTPLTLQTLATLMISQSDNTATDALIEILGREEIETFAPRNQPFLTTREAFTLKNPDNQVLLERYRQGDLTSRRELLTEVKEAPLPNKAIFQADQPLATDVEWFFTSRELCNLLDEVAGLPLMSVNPGAAKAENWERVAFKGGSEPGVLNFTTQLKSQDGKTYCVVATWNNSEALDDLGFFTLYSSVIENLKQNENGGEEAF